MPDSVDNTPQPSPLPGAVKRPRPATKASSWMNGFPWWASALIQTGPVGVMCAMLWFMQQDSARQRQEEFGSLREEIKLNRDSVQAERKAFSTLLSQQWTFSQKQHQSLQELIQQLITEVRKLRGEKPPLGVSANNRAPRQSEKKDAIQ